MSATTVHFHHLPELICRHLARAERHIRLAVCWFSHREVFDVLLEKLRAGVSVELILEYDTQNIRPGGLDFTRFIRLGGRLYAYRDTALMHHKFALIDDATLLTGSFNWTYTANAENLLTATDPALIAAFRDEFNRLKGLSVQVRKIRPADVKVFNGFPLFENTRVQLADLRLKISGGARVWWVHAGRHPAAWAEHFRAHRLPFDEAGVLRPYWTAYRYWDEDLFDERWPALEAASTPAAACGARLFSRRMHNGDLVLAVARRAAIVALGVVQSDPKPSTEGKASSYREVHWLRVLADAPVALNKVAPPGAGGRFRGSALQVVQALWER